MSRRILIRGGCVLTLGAKTSNFSEADVVIEDGRIAEVGRGLRARDAEQVDASDSIVMPGFVDTHRHAWTSLFRNLGVSGDGGGALPEAAVYGRHYRPEDVYAATLIGLLGALETGITTVVDWADIQFDEAYTDAALQAHADAGGRTVFVHALPHWAGDREDPISRVRRVVADHGPAATPTTTVAYGPDEPGKDTLAGVADEWTRARGLGLRMHVHTRSKASRGLVSSLAAGGLLADDITFVHCSNLEDADLDAIASSKASLSLTPSSEMAIGLGPPPMQKLIDRGIRPGLGIDDERLGPGDMFAQMRVAISIQHATYFDLKLAGKAGLPNLLTTREVIRYATSDGARVAGLGDVTGSIEPGRQADIIVLRTDRPNIFPVNDPIGAVVWGMDASNIDKVFVGGRELVREGRLVADVQRARELAVAAQQRVTRAAGLADATLGAGQ